MQYKFDQPVHGTMGATHYQCAIKWQDGEFIADEPISSGGKAQGPDPYSLLLSSLASCTLITLRMYIDRKGWDITEIEVNVNLYQETVDDKTTTFIDRDIVFPGSVSDEQKLRLQEIATHCPISKILQNDIKVRTFLLREGDREKTIKYANDEITVVWKPEFCQHSKRCWSQLPEVFDYKIKKWINPDGAPAEKISEQVQKCPSGALTFYYNKK